VTNRRSSSWSARAAGDRDAVEALLQRCLPGLRRWAHGRLPPAARASLDTQDLVQETVLHVLRRLDHFEPRHVGAMQAYLRQSVINRIPRRSAKGQPPPSSVELPADLMSDRTSPLEVGRAVGGVSALPRGASAG
jgi:RNA polymerase sigma-70 factor (ECF subfamily)